MYSPAWKFVNPCAFLTFWVSNDIQASLAASDVTVHWSAVRRLNRNGIQANGIHHLDNPGDFCESKLSAPKQKCLTKTQCCSPPEQPSPDYGSVMVWGCFSSFTSLKRNHEFWRIPEDSWKEWQAISPPAKASLNVGVPTRQGALKYAFEQI